MDLNLSCDLNKSFCSTYIFGSFRYFSDRVLIPIPIEYVMRSRSISYMYILYQTTVSKPLHIKYIIVTIIILQNLKNIMYKLWCHHAVGYPCTSRILPTNSWWLPPPRSGFSMLQPWSEHKNNSLWQIFFFGFVIRCN